MKIPFQKNHQLVHLRQKCFLHTENQEKTGVTPLLSGAPKRPCYCLYDFRVCREGRRKRKEEIESNLMTLQRVEVGVEGDRSLYRCKSFVWYLYLPFQRRKESTCE
jgi:hypothetical protein